MLPLPLTQPLAGLQSAEDVLALRILAVAVPEHPTRLSLLVVVVILGEEVGVSSARLSVHFVQWLGAGF